MNEKPQPFKIDYMLLVGGFAIIALTTLGGAFLLALPIAIFTFVLAVLRIWIKPKPGQRFFSPGIWWGTIYGVLGLAISFIGGQSLFAKDITAQQIGMVVLIAAVLQLVIPGTIVAFLGYRRSVEHNKTLIAKPE